MAVSYKKLWKLLIDKDMKKMDLRKCVGLSSGTIAKMGHNEYVALEVIDRICEFFDCDIDDVVECLRRSNFTNGHQAVNHKTFGVGVVQEIDKNEIIVKFDSCGIKRFIYPDVFHNGYMTLI